MGADTSRPDGPASAADHVITPAPVATRDVVRVPVRPAHRPEVVGISSESLLAGANEVQIEHRGALYRLKQTSLGKLILTK
jgi:hemin uptake protein HemP